MLFHTGPLTFLVLIFLLLHAPPPVSPFIKRLYAKARKAILGPKKYQNSPPPKLATQYPVQDPTYAGRAGCQRPASYTPQRRQTYEGPQYTRPLHTHPLSQVKGWTERLNQARNEPRYPPAAPPVVRKSPRPGTFPQTRGQNTGGIQAGHNPGFQEYGRFGNRPGHFPSPDASSLSSDDGLYHNDGPRNAGTQDPRMYSHGPRQPAVRASNRKPFQKHLGPKDQSSESLDGYETDFSSEGQRFKPKQEKVLGASPPKNTLWPQNLPGYFNQHPDQKPVSEWHNKHYKTPEKIAPVRKNDARLMREHGMQYDGNPHLDEYHNGSYIDDSYEFDQYISPRSGVQTPPHVKPQPKFPPSKPILTTKGHNFADAIGKARQVNHVKPQRSNHMFTSANIEVPTLDLDALDAKLRLYSRGHLGDPNHTDPYHSLEVKSEELTAEENMLKNLESSGKPLTDEQVYNNVGNKLNYGYERLNNRSVPVEKKKKAVNVMVDALEQLEDIENRNQASGKPSSMPPKLRSWAQVAAEDLDKKMQENPELFNVANDNGAYVPTPPQYTTDQGEEEHVARNLEIFLDALSKGIVTDAEKAKMEFYLDEAKNLIRKLIDGENKNWFKGMVSEVEKELRNQTHLNGAKDNAHGSPNTNNSSSDVFESYPSSRSDFEYPDPTAGGDHPGAPINPNSPELGGNSMATSKVQGSNIDPLQPPPQSEAAKKYIPGMPSTGARAGPDPFQTPASGAAKINDLSNGYGTSFGGNPRADQSTGSTDNLFGSLPQSRATGNVGGEKRKDTVGGHPQTTPIVQDGKGSPKVQASQNTVPQPDYTVPSGVPDHTSHPDVIPENPKNPIPDASNKGFFPGLYNSASRFIPHPFNRNQLAEDHNQASGGQPSKTPKVYETPSGKPTMVKPAAEKKDWRQFGGSVADSLKGTTQAAADLGYRFVDPVASTGTNAFSNAAAAGRNAMNGATATAQDTIGNLGSTANQVRDSASNLAGGASKFAGDASKLASGASRYMPNLGKFGGSGMPNMFGGGTGTQPPPDVNKNKATDNKATAHDGYAQRFRGVFGGFGTSKENTSKPQQTAPAASNNGGWGFTKWGRN